LLTLVFASFGDESSSCEACSAVGGVRESLFCTNCNKYYHPECFMPESNRVVRTGWRCPDRKICQTCRQSDDDVEMIIAMYVIKVIIYFVYVINIYLKMILVAQIV